MTFQKFVTPFLLNLVLVYFTKTSDNSSEQFNFLIVGFTKFSKTFLQDVVSELALDNLREIIGCAQLIKNFVLNVDRSFFNTDLDELGGVFILRKLYKITFHLIKNLFVCLIIKSLKNFGNHKISKFVLNISQRILQDFTYDDLLRIFIFSKLN